MKKQIKIGGLSILLLALLGISAVLYSKGFINYLIISGTFSIISLIVLLDTFCMIESLAYPAIEPA